MSYPVGKDPVAVAVTNSVDGNLEIFAANQGDNTVSVLQADATGAFTTASPPLSVTDGSNNGMGPDAVAVSRIFEGYLFNVYPVYEYVLVTANSGDDTVSVLTEAVVVEGPGLFYSTGFGPAVTCQVGNDPDAVALGQDGQGDAVIFVANAGDGTVTELTYNLNTGVFGPATTYTVGDHPDALALGTDPSGNAILAVANKGDGTVSVFVGNADGTFPPPSASYQAATYKVGNGPEGVKLALDKGNLDIVTANYADNTVSLLREGAGDVFLPATSYPAGAGPDALSLAYDAQGNLYILATDAQANSVSVLEGDFPSDLVTPRNGVAIRHVPFLQDLTGNSVPDELILDGSGELLFREGLAGQAGQFASPIVINPGRPARDATVFQTADGWAVAAVDAKDNAVSIYTWSAAANGFVLTGDFATGNLPVRIAAYDLTGDGRDDLVVANGLDNSVTIAFQAPDGQFGNVITRAVGAAPSDVAFADLGGNNGADIVVSGQASGDVTVLFNDPTHSFSQQSRYRAGAGLFNIDDSTGTQTIASQLLTNGVVAGDFTGPNSDDLVVLNRGAKSITLLPNQGQGGTFADPQAGDAYPTGDQPAQIAKLTLPGDTLPSVAVLMQNTDDKGDGQIWIYRNNGKGGFDAPVMIGNLGNDPTNFSFATVGGKLALLVGNAFGDILTLLYDGNLNDANGGFAPDRAGLNATPLAGGMTGGREFAVVADQQSGKVNLYYRILGTDQFTCPVAVPAQLLLAPGAAHTFYVPNDANPYLAVAEGLGNDVLIYHYDPAGGFDFVQRVAVGDDPVSITVGDVNGDGAPDLLVANKGSNDVSVLIGSTTTGVWNATPYQRLRSGGLGPVGVAVQDTGGANGPNLLVTNGDGTVTTLAGIGAGGKGSGFFQDSAPASTQTGKTITDAVFDAATAQTFALSSDGTVGVLTNGVLKPFSLSGGASTLAAIDSTFGSFLVVGFDNGTVGLLSPDGTVLQVEATGFSGAPAPWTCCKTATTRTCSSSVTTRRSWCRCPSCQ